MKSRSEHTELPAISESEYVRFRAVLVSFLEGMPELGIKPECEQDAEIVRDCYSNNVAEYILTSFDNFVDQVVLEPLL